MCVMQFCVTVQKLRIFNSKQVVFGTVTIGMLVEYMLFCDMTDMFLWRNSYDVIMHELSVR